MKELLKYTEAMLEHKKTWTTPSKKDKKICEMLEEQRELLIKILKT